MMGTSRFCLSKAFICSLIESLLLAYSSAKTFWCKAMDNTTIKKTSATICLILTIIATPSIGVAERKSIFEEKSNEAHEQLFDYDFGWKLCVMERKEATKYLNEANELRKKYEKHLYKRNTSEESKAFLNENEEEVKRMIDIFTIKRTSAQANKKRCEHLKNIGFFGLEHKKE